jgi:O-antigen ligase
LTVGAQIALAAPFLYLLIAAEFAAGANSAMPSLLLVALHALALLAWLIASRNARARMTDGGVLIAPGVFFAAVLAVAGWSLTAYTPGGPLPVWEWVGMTGAATLDRSATFLEMIKLCGLACIFLVGFIQGGRAQTASNTLRLLLILSTAYGFFALMSFLQEGAGAGTSLNQVKRLSGGFLSANSTGTVFGILSVLALSWVLQSIRGVQREQGRSNAVEQLARVAPRVSVLILLLGCLLLTSSRSAITITAGVMVAAIVWEVMSGGLKGRSGAAMITTSAIYLGVLLAGAGAVALSRFDRLSGDLAERGAMFAVHWKMFTVSPLFGWGLGTFDHINQQTMTPTSNVYLWRLRATHNVVLQWLEEAGLIGAAPMFLTIAAIVGLTFWGLRRRQETAPWIRGLLLTNVVILAHGMSDFAIQVPMIAALWAFLLGLQLSMANPQHRRQPGR